MRPATTCRHVLHDNPWRRAGPLGRHPTRPTRRTLRGFRRGHPHSGNREPDRAGCKSVGGENDGAHPPAFLFVNRLARPATGITSGDLAPRPVPPARQRPSSRFQQHGDRRQDHRPRENFQPRAHDVRSRTVCSFAPAQFVDSFYYTPGWPSKTGGPVGAGDHPPTPKHLQSTLAAAPACPPNLTRAHWTPSLTGPVRGTGWVRRRHGGQRTTTRSVSATSPASR